MNESRANTNTSSHQQYTSLALLRDGRVILGWEGWQLGASDCYGQIYTPDGTPQGAEFLLNHNNSSGWEYGPVFAPLPGNGFAVTWGDTSATTEGQVWSGSSPPQPVGPGVQIVPRDLWPAAATASSGEFVVLLGRSNSMRARRYSSTGQALGPDFQVNTGALTWARDNVSTAAAAYRSDGAVLVAWADGSDIRARLFASDWTYLGTEVTINSATGGERDMPSVVAATTGEFYVTWHGPGTGDADGIFARRVDRLGNPVGVEWLVNQTTARPQDRAQAAISQRDELLVVWRGADVSGMGVYARMHDQGGAPVGPEVLVNQWTGGDQNTSWNAGRTGVLFAGETIFVSWWGSAPGDGSGNGVGLSILRPMGAVYETFGAGCPGSSGTPRLTASQLPRVGQPLGLTVSQMPSGAPGAVFPFGLSRTRWGLYVLPLDLGPIGMSGCSLLVSGEVSPIPIQANALGVGAWTLVVPNNAALEAVEFLNQAVVSDPGVNPLGVTMSNGGRGVIGL